MRGRQTLGGYEVMGSCYVMFIRFGRRPPFFFFLAFILSSFYGRRRYGILSFFLGMGRGKGECAAVRRAMGGCEGYVLIFFLHDRWGRREGVTILVYTFCYCWGETLILGITICWGVMDGFREGRELLSWRGFWG